MHAVNVDDHIVGRARNCWGRQVFQHQILLGAVRSTQPLPGTEWWNLLAQHAQGFRVETHLREV